MKPVTENEWTAAGPPSSRMCLYLQQLRDHRQHLGVADIDGVVPVGLPLVADVAQVKDGRQQAEDPKCQAEEIRNTVTSRSDIVVITIIFVAIIILFSLTACEWQAGIPPSPWPAEASQSHASGLLLPL